MKDHAIIIITLVVSTASSIADSFMLLDTSGSVHPVQITNIGPAEIEFIDTEEGFTTLPHDECIAFLRPVPYSTGTSRSSITLHDGQVFPGRMTDGPDTQHIHWKHDWIGDLKIPLDQVDRIIMDGSAADSDSDTGSDSDVVHLRNGDVVEGFLISVSPSVRIETLAESGGSIVDIQHDRIVEIDLFGDTRDPIDPTVWTTDGTIVHLPVITVGSDGYLAAGAHMYAMNPEMEIDSGPPLQSIHAVSFSGSRIHPLGTLDIVSLDGPTTRVSVPPPHITDPSAPLGLSPIEFRGPLTLQYRLPAGSLRFRSTIRMPTSALKWGDCDLGIFVDDLEVHRCSFNSNQPEHQIDIEVSGDVLEITLDEGANGPVQDHIRFEYGMLMPTVDSAVRTLDEPTEGVGGTTGID